MEPDIDPLFPRPNNAGDPGHDVPPAPHPAYPVANPSPAYPPAYPPAISDPMARGTSSTSTSAPVYASPFAASPLASTVPPARRAFPWSQAILTLVLLIVLATGIGIGAAVASSRANAAKTTLLPSSASGTVTLPTTVQDLQQTIITTIQADQPSVVEVKSSSARGGGIGTGEFLTADGYIVTNDHVVSGSTSFNVVLADGTTHSAQLVGEDAQDDLAVLKTDITNAKPITVADSGQAQIGQFVLALGSPLGLQQSATFGIISALNRTEQENASTNGFSSAGGPVLTGLIQTSAPINPGNSGGALVDLQGRLLGITTLGASGQQAGQTISGIGFAIPSNRVKTITTQLIQQGHVSNTGQGFLGIQGQDVTPDVAAADGLNVQSGVLVQGFANDAQGSSPAQTAGLKVGDVITAVNGQSIADSSSLAGAIITLAPGTKVSLTIERGTSQMTVSVTLGERPLAAQG